jgi:cell wall-associated NlpC family hydrolase
MRLAGCHPRRMRRTALLAASVAVLAAGAGGLAIANAGQDTSRPAVAAAAPAPAQAADTLPPLPEQMRPKVVEPVAGASTGAAGSAPVHDPGLDSPGPVPTGPASSAARRGNGYAGGHGSVNQATALANGIAVPPLEAPEAVKRIIEAGNVIARTPYLWGGGHGKWIDKGYDCSGSVSFALAAAGYLDGPLTSGLLMNWGDAGPGKWVTIYANDGHVFLEVAGIRFDTSASRVTGSRWANEGRSTAGFAVRHPPGL